MPQMQLSDVRAILDDIKGPFGELQLIERVAENGHPAVYALRVSFIAKHTTSGEKERQHGIWWDISPWACRSEIVQTALSAYLWVAEHEIREKFKYKGRTIFFPHYNVEALWHFRGKTAAVEVRDEH